MIQQKITEIAEILGWSVDFSEPQNGKTDVDEEAYIWIGSDGHGKNGAPYHIADIVKDMEEAEVMMADLYEAFRQYYSQLELQAV